MTSRVPVIVYVAPAGSRAASAGFFILESADVAAMAPGTNTGAAHPVLLGEKMDEIMKTKMENDAAAFMRTIANKRGRNVAVAESAVRESKSFTEQEALQQKLIDVIAPNEQSLLRAIDGRTFKRFDGTNVTLHVANAQINTIEMSLRQRLMSSLMDPNIAFMLLVLGGLAIFAEFNHPGAVLPGVVGVIAIVLALFALNFLPTRFAALALLLVGIRALRARGEVRVARRPRHRRHREHGHRRAVSRRRADPADAREPPHGARREHSDRRHRGVPDDARPASAARNGRHGQRRDDRRRSASRARRSAPTAKSSFTASCGTPSPAMRSPRGRACAWPA